MCIKYDGIAHSSMEQSLPVVDLFYDTGCAKQIGWQVVWSEFSLIDQGQSANCSILPAVEPISVWLWWRQRGLSWSCFTMPLAHSHH
jgi:hypothetical protein